MLWSVTRKLAVVSVLVIITFHGVNGQLQFERVQATPVLPPSNYGWDCRYICQPSVLYVNGRYNMWYTGWDGSGEMSIGYAYSFNGINWFRSPENPVLNGNFAYWMNGIASNPAVTDIGGKFVMFFSNNGSLGTRFAMAVSLDGIHWRPKHDPVLTTGPVGAWDSFYIHNCSSILKMGGQYWIWYSGKGPEGWNIGAATSDDVIHWVKHPANPVLRNGIPGEWDNGRITFPEVFKVGGGLEMWYSGRPTDGISRGSIGKAFSNDGVNWEKSIYNPVCGPDPLGRWDDYRVISSAILYEDSTVKLWYQGTNGGSQWAVGLVTADISEQHYRTPESRANNENPQSQFRIKGPNPFKRRISMEIIPTNEGITNLTIYNILGQSIRHLNFNMSQNVPYIVNWDGRDDFGNEVTNGVYFVQMEGNREVLTKKILKVE